MGQNMTRVEHLEWCKQRAREYRERGDSQEAMTSMLSDLRKHPETELMLSFAGNLMFLAAQEGTTEAARKFIEGFN